MSIFEGIGKIGDYTHLRSLQREMKYRIKTGASLRQAMGAQTQPICKGRTIRAARTAKGASGRSCGRDRNSPLPTSSI